MPRSRIFIFILLLLLTASLVTPAAAAASIQIVSDAASPSFPDSLLFSAEFQGTTNITAVVLEYGVKQLTCGTVDARAFPQVTAGTDVKVNWTWQMLESGTLPPGSTVWWHWLVTASDGTQFTSPTKTVLWIDNTHAWQAINGGNINLHYYDRDSSFGQQLHDAATQALVRLSQDVGVSTDSPVDIYIYADSTDLQNAILFSPTWVGGQAFPENNIVIIGIPTDQLDWGKSTEAHELTHVLVGHLTFSCLGFIPTWLNEGLAMYGQGGVEPAEQAQFDQAKAANQLPSLRSLTGQFSAEGTRAQLSYTVAYSVVDFMRTTYGRDKMTALLLDLKNGQTIDQALLAVYGLNTEGLENAWRNSIGAKILSGPSQPTPVPTPTVIPTYVPISAAPLAATAAMPSPPVTQAQAETAPAGATPSPLPTAGPTPSAGLPGLSTGIITRVLAAALACLVVAVLLVGLIIFLIVRAQNRSRK